MPTPCLPVLSATSCSIHMPERGEARLDDERQLVAAGAGQRAQVDAQPQAGVVVAG